MTRRRAQAAQMSLDYSSSHTYQWGGPGQPVSYDLNNISMYPDAAYESNASDMAELLSRDLFDNMTWGNQFDDINFDDINTSTDPFSTVPAL